MRNGGHPSPRLQAAWIKHGEGAFIFTVLEECAAEERFAREQHYIDALRPDYNSMPVVAVITDEMRAKMVGKLRANAAAITHCPKGHAYDEANTYLSKAGKRICRACNAERVGAIFASLTPEQREARRQAAAAAYEANKDARRAQMLSYRQDNVEAKRAYDTDPANRAKANERKRQAQLTETAQQREARLERKRQPHQRHREQNLAKMRAYHASRGADAQKKEA